MKTMSSNERLVFSVALGYVVILNIIGSSRFEFYPTNLLIGVAFGVGIAMVVGSLAFFLKEPKWLKSLIPTESALHNPKQVLEEVPFHYAKRVPLASGC